MKIAFHWSLVTLFYLSMAGLVPPFILNSIASQPDNKALQKEGLNIVGRQKASENSQSNDGIGELELAILRGKTDTVRKLLEEGANPNLPERQLLSESIVNGHYDITLLLLEYGADPNLASPYGGTSALMEATYKGKIQIMKALIQKGADVNYNDYVGGGTALNSAIDGNHVDAVQLLLEHGADPSLSGKFHDDPWKAAKKLPNKTILDILKQYKSNCHERPSRCNKLTNNRGQITVSLSKAIKE